MTLLTLTPGTLFAGRYRITRCIAQGGMGAVYEVVHLETERRRALKVMLPDMLQSQEMRDRFRQEARVTANIESEFLVDVFDAGIDETTKMPFLVMEFLRGEEVHKKLKRDGRFPFADVVTYLYQAALALDKTHRASIVHRDLKPGNLFLTERDDGSPRVKVLDFGIAKLVAEGATNAEATRNLGTPVYMAPEQFYIGGKVSPASDIFALGMIAFTLLVGTPYWHEEMTSGANVFAFAASAVLGPQESACLRAGRRGVQLPPAFDAWFQKITANEPSERFATATSAVIALADALGVPFGPAGQRPAPAEPQSTASLNVASPITAPRSDAVGVWPVDGRAPRRPTYDAPASALLPQSSAPPQSAAPPQAFAQPSALPPTPSFAQPLSPSSNPLIAPSPSPAGAPPVRQPQASLPFIATGLAPAPFAPAPDASRVSVPPPPPPGFGVTTPASNPSFQATPGAYPPPIQSSSPTTSTGVITGMPAASRRPTPVFIASAIGGSIIAVLLLVLLLIDGGSSKSAAQPPRASDAASASPSQAITQASVEAASAASAAPSVLNVDEPPSASAAPSVMNLDEPPAASASASSNPKKPPKPGGGTGPKRPVIYTPD